MYIVVFNSLNEYMNQLAQKYTKNDDDVSAMFEWWATGFEAAYAETAKIVVPFLYSVKKTDEARFYRVIDQAFGISLQSIIEKENIQRSFNLAVMQNLDLIKSLGFNQLTRLKNVVSSDLRDGVFSPKSIRNMIIHDFGITSRHADFIARDQSHKMTSTLNQLRYENLGIETYFWRTANDNRVRGNPAGLYPNAKPSHFKYEGRVFAFKNPPPGGNPGMDYNCRCHAEAIIPEIMLKEIEGNNARSNGSQFKQRSS
jgi:SPP1 gp7 family putative phage head morphogenesis protein